jgi:hypothetical protein
MKKVTIDNESALVDDRLEGFTIHTKPSSNVEFFGSSEDGRVFVQFNSGATYIYSNVPADTISAMAAAASIGKYVSEFIVKPNVYPSEKHGDRLVRYEKSGVTGEDGNDLW